MDDRGPLTERDPQRIKQPFAGPAESTADHHQGRADEQRDDAEPVRERFHRVMPDLSRDGVRAQPSGDVAGAGDVASAQPGVAAGDRRRGRYGFEAPRTAAPAPGSGPDRPGADLRRLAAGARPPRAPRNH